MGATIYVDIDRERLRAIVGMAYDLIAEEQSLQTLHRPKEVVLEDLGKIIDGSRISVQFFLDVSSPKAKDLILRVDSRRREVLCLSARHVALKNKINTVLRAL